MAGARMTAFLLILLACFGGEPQCVEQRCEWIELHHLCDITYDDHGKPVVRETLRQFVFWRGVGRGQCIAWRLARGGETIIEDRRGVMLMWHDGDTLRVVRAKFLLETATLEDVEVVNREVCPPEQRRGLGMVLTRKGTP